MKKSLLSTALLLVLAGCNSSNDSNDTKPPTPPVVTYPDFTDVSALGGDTTSPETSNSGHGFSTPAPNLTASELQQHLDGDANFEQAFTTAPNAEHPEFDGLGPVLNNQDCNSCHQRDGRSSTLSIPAGKSEIKLGADAGIFLRISIEDDEPCTEQTADNNYCEPKAVPGFSSQLFHRGVLKARKDWEDYPFGGQADVYLSYEYSEVSYADGEVVKLKKPILEIRNPYDAPGEHKGSMNLTSRLFQDDVKTGPRNGMPVFGLGLLEAIPEAAILALADEKDANNDGISGRPNWVFDKIKADNGDSRPVSLGRFGWKANTPTVRHQSLGALRGDMGITNPLFPNESIVGTPMHDDYLTRTNFTDTGKDANGAPEADATFSDDVVFYAETLAVPARRNVKDAKVREGARLFDEINCTGCHTPSFTTGNGADMQIGGKPAIAGLKNQTIYPFTDMLLHDMGEGLADGRRDFLANGNEWKTRPLWGLGLTKTVNPAAGFLHDGRAETVEEAILWHGGEAEASKEQFRKLAKADREALVSFLKSL